MNVPRPRVAYFSMEFGLHEKFPIYAGGLGVLAGDFMKSAGDLGLPVVGVGLLWSEGYGRQRIGPDGRPYDEFSPYSRDFLVDTGARMRVRVAQREVECRVWVVDCFGNAPLYLIEPVRAQDAWITRRLYDPSPDCRIAQEMLLGIGGVRALRQLGFDAGLYHFNEGHAVFGGVEMIAEQMSRGESFENALAAVRRQVVFTTHTPVPAGNEEHGLGDLRRLGACCELVDAEMAALGGSPFNMTVAGLRLSRRANAVAELHGHTARAMWKHVTGAAPIVSITNGVHRGTWQDPRIAAATGDDDRLWAARQATKGELLDEIARRSGVRLDSEGLLIGFARRATPYKRPDLVLRDPARIAPLLASGRLKLVFAGKAHSADEKGKAVVANLVRAARAHPHAVVFLENYDMALGRLLTRGCDVWLNNPRRPMEASGTSGMKAAMNGVLNLSILDGWWPEGCRHGENGWAFGVPDASADDDRDALDLYRVLEQEVLPAWADRRRWVRMARASIASSEERFSSDRMVREYFELLYAPDAARSAAA